MNTKTHLEIAEEYVEWASRHNISRHTVCQVLFQSWKHFHLSDDEKQYLQVLAQIHCPEDHTRNLVDQAWLDIGVSKPPQPVKATASAIIEWLKKLRK